MSQHLFPWCMSVLLFLSDTSQSHIVIANHKCFVRYRQTHTTRDCTCDGSLNPPLGKKKDGRSTFYFGTHTYTSTLSKDFK